MSWRHPRDLKDPNNMMASFLASAQSGERLSPGLPSGSVSRSMTGSGWEPGQTSLGAGESGGGMERCGTVEGRVESGERRVERKRAWCARDEKQIPFACPVEVLDSWERCSVSEWGMEEVLAWTMSVARRQSIPPEDISLHKFVSLTGGHLLKFTRSQFLDLSPKMGQFLYEDLIRVESTERISNGQASSSRDVAKQCMLPTSLATDDNSNLIPQKVARTSSTVLTPPSHILQYLTNGSNLSYQQPSFLDQFFPPAASATPGHSDIHHSSYPAQNSNELGDRSPPPLSRQASTSSICTANTGDEDVKPTIQQLLAASQNIQHPNSRKASLLRRWGEESEENPELYPFLPNSADQLASQALAINRSIFSHLAAKTSAEYMRALERHTSLPLTSHQHHSPNPDTPDVLDREEQEYRANFPPRNKRAHGKKHVLWQFILLCLGDPKACPSVVRWEDRERGIFRIVNSLELAKLWGLRKNRNKTMSYEKLSRAMRAYYKEGILFPGPRSGRYPKKLVYQFGPNAEGWREVASGERVTDVLAIETTAL